MSRRRVAALALVAAALVAACFDAPDDGTACGRAKTELAQCGVMMPFELGETCTGTTAAISECVVAAGGSCEALAEVARHLDRCSSREAGAPVPDDFPALRAGDASTDAAPRASERDAGSAPVDAGKPVVDAGRDASSGTVVFDVSGVVASGQTLSFESRRLGPGVYTFAPETTGAVDVFLRKGFAPTTTTWDCKTSSAATACAMNVTTSAVLYVLVRGTAATSPFRITGTEGSP